MKLVTFKNAGGLVSVDIAITGLVEWRYKYVTDTHERIRKSGDAPPFTHAVGFPNELHLDSNAWDVHLVNTGDAAADYTVAIRWIQDDQELESWTANGSLAAGDYKIEAGDAFLVGA